MSDLSKNLYDAIKDGDIKRVQDCMTNIYFTYENLDTGQVAQYDKYLYKLKYPIHWASIYGKVNIVELLLKSCRVNIHVRSFAPGFDIGLNSLHYASMHGYGQVVQLLLENGADIHSTSSGCGMTSLHIASKSKNVEVVKLLLEHDANPNVKNVNGNTPKQLTSDYSVSRIFEQYERMYKLKEWRPWNHTEYPSEYREVMLNVVVLAKANYKNDDKMSNIQLTSNKLFCGIVSQ